MTNQQMLDIYTVCAGGSHISGLRAVWNAGYCQGAGITPNANMQDYSANIAKPTAVIAKTKK